MTTMPSKELEPRAALIRAAQELLEVYGFEQMTLQSVGAHAQLPIEAVRGHFQTKDALTEAVVAANEQALVALLTGWNGRHAEPRQRLHCLVLALREAKSPLIGLRPRERDWYLELEKEQRGTVLGNARARLVTLYLDWAEVQFLLRRHAKQEAGALAEQLLASVHGILIISESLATHVSSAAQIVRLERWLWQTVGEPD